MLKKHTLFLETKAIEALKKLGKEKGLKPSQLIRLAISEYLQREKK
jgi:hypothetical protein